MEEPESIMDALPTGGGGIEDYHPRKNIR